MTFHIDITGRNMEVTDRLSDYVIKKVSKLDRYLNDIDEAHVDLAYAKSARSASDRQVAQLTIRGKGFILRSEERADDIYAALDTALDKMQRRIERYKGKRNRRRGDGRSAAEVVPFPESYEEEEPPIIVRRKQLSKLLQISNLFLDTEIDEASIENATQILLQAIGEDISRTGLERTPIRVAQMYAELLAGYRTDPVTLVNDALFEVTYDEMVLVRDIEFYSLCEHHLLPFMGKAHVAYFPKGKVIGLSKIPRIVDLFSRRLQLQERMTRQIADFIEELLEPHGVAVVVEGIHLCAMMRGVQKHEARMTTSAMLGAFMSSIATRQEFLDNISRGAGPMKF